MKKIVNQKKLNDQEVAYNWKAKEVKDQLAREAAERKR